MKVLVKIYLIFFGLVTVNSFYLPGLAPVNYCKKEDEVDYCKVKKVIFIHRFIIKRFFCAIVENSSLRKPFKYRRICNTL